MTFTYTPGASAKDDVRLLIGDVDSSASESARLDDEEIDRLIAIEGSEAFPGLYLGAAACAEALSAKFLRLAEGSAGPQRYTPMSRSTELRALATRLRVKGARGAAPVVGVTTIPFSVGMMDNA